MLSFDFHYIFWVGHRVFLISAFCLHYAVLCTLLIQSYIILFQWKTAPGIFEHLGTRRIAWVLCPVTQRHSVFNALWKLNVESSGPMTSILLRCWVKLMVRRATQTHCLVLWSLGCPQSLVCIPVAEVLGARKICWYISVHLTPEMMENEEVLCPSFPVRRSRCHWTHQESGVFARFSSCSFAVPKSQQRTGGQEGGVDSWSEHLRHRQAMSVKWGWPAFCMFVKLLTFPEGEKLISVFEIWKNCQKCLKSMMNSVEQQQHILCFAAV